jgi:hypothetical protein
MDCSAQVLVGHSPNRLEVRLLSAKCSQHDPSRMILQLRRYRGTIQAAHRFTSRIDAKMRESGSTMGNAEAVIREWHY